LIVPQFIEQIRLRNQPRTPARVHWSMGDFFLSTAVLQFTAAAVTDRGRKRPSNEDAFGYSVEDGIFLVCDGMGGAAAGEIASSIAVDEMLRLLSGRTQGEGSAAPMPQLAEDAIATANAAIFSRSRRNSRLSGMGTTLVGLVAEERRLWALNVGDSRCYRLRNRRLEQITRDHSLVEEQVRMGRMSVSEALRSPLRNVITRALGTRLSPFRLRGRLWQRAPDRACAEEAHGDGVKREDLWITSKLWNDKHAEKDVIPDLPQIAEDLQLDYLDLYLVHWPFPNFHPPGCDVNFHDPNAKPYIHESYMKTWRQLEKLVDEGSSATSAPRT
jgi:serine/threonine protein phosphatase PrpC